MTPWPSVEFCEQLFRHGVLHAARWHPGSDAQALRVQAIILQADQVARLDAPAQAPTLDMQAAQWALSTLAWSASLLVDRANDQTALPAELAGSEPLGDQPCHHWSVDLAFRYLADVLLRAQAAASEDALVGELTTVCSRWPLSSVGTPATWNQERGKILLADACLRLVLLDRIALRRDQRLAELSAIREARR